MQYWFGFAPPLVLEAAVRHKLFDALAGGPKTAEQVAAETGVSGRGAKAVLGALVGLEVLTRSGDKFALTPEAETFLVSTSPAYRGGLFQHASSQLIPGWLHLTQTVKTGRPEKAVNTQAEGAEFFRQFVEDLYGMNIAASRALADRLNLSGPVKVLDIAAGSGVWSIPIARKDPAARVTVVDWPEVLPVCQKVAAEHGVADRYSYIPGDILAVDYGTGYNIATLGHILHSEGVERSKRLLKKVYDALAPGGTIVIAEMVPNDERTGPPFPMLFGVNMLLHTSEGDVFTFAQMTDWLSAIGFRDVRQLDVSAPSPLVLATKPVK
jgi:ubiquinone/menaquinone biosynthesis C-methylase UbiE